MTDPKKDELMVPSINPILTAETQSTQGNSLSKQSKSVRSSRLCAELFFNGKTPGTQSELHKENNK
jgi:hypothetical protein